MAESRSTRADALALADERRLIQQGYEFLDEKRMLLAGEILRQLKAWQQAMASYQQGAARARRALDAAIARHGLEGLQVYPVGTIDGVIIARSSHSFFGVPLIDVALPDTVPVSPAPAPIDPSSEAETCAQAFRTLLPLATILAAHATNLQRLGDAYRRTERRARAIENVHLPEITVLLKTIEEHLKAVDQEEAVRVRRAAGTGGQTGSHQSGGHQKGS